MSSEEITPKKITNLTEKQLEEIRQLFPQIDLLSKLATAINSEEVNL